jgi:hypothetical protein
MAGRCISVSHEALGTVRVMRTCGMMGEVVGRAAYLSVYHNTTPRGVYERHLPQLLDLLRQPGAMRRSSMSDPLVADASIPAVVAYGPKPDGKPGAAKFIEAKALPGIVIDDALATLRGEWARGDGLTNFVGAGYRYHAGGSDAAARFEFSVPIPGRYEVRVASQPHENRSTRTSCTLERTGLPPVKLRLNQREATSDPYGFQSIGVFEFGTNGRHAVVLSADGADGLVHADCIQVLPANP